METFYGKFRKVKIKPLNGYGNYRGEGKIEFTDDGFRICGRHVFSLGARWGLGLAIFFGLLIVTSGLFAPGFIPLYLILEYVWLKREDTMVPFSDVINYVSDPKQTLIAIDFHGPQWCRPIVLKTEKWQEALAILRQKIPNQDASLMVNSPLSKGRAIWLSSLMFIGSYLLFIILTMLIVVPIMTSQGVSSIPDIKNTMTRTLTWFIVFGLPFFSSILLAKWYYRKKRMATRLDSTILPPSEAISKK
jgi:hypothetical protein